VNGTWLKVDDVDSAQTKSGSIEANGQDAVEEEKSI
jgi:hypothetical protein